MEGLDKQVGSNMQIREERESQNYLKLKRKFKALREEYLKVLSNWEDTHKKVKTLSKEKKFLRDKLDCFIKSQHYNISDEALTAAILAKNNDTSSHQIGSGQMTAPAPKHMSQIMPGQQQPQISTQHQNVQQQQQQQSNQQPSQKRKKKDQMHHHQYYQIASVSSHMVQPIFGTQDVSKLHPSNHHHGQHQPPASQNIFQSSANGASNPLTNNYVEAQGNTRQPIFNTNFVVNNGNRIDQPPHNVSKNPNYPNQAMLKQDPSGSNQVHLMPEFQVIPNQIKQQQQQQISQHQHS